MVFINDGKNHQSSLYYGVVSNILYFIVCFTLSELIFYSNLYQTTSIVVLSAGILSSFYCNLTKYSILGKDFLKNNVTSIIAETLFMLLGLIYTHLCAGEGSISFMFVITVALIVVLCWRSTKRLNFVAETGKAKSKQQTIALKACYVLIWGVLFCAILWQRL